MRNLNKIITCVSVSLAHTIAFPYKHGFSSWKSIVSNWSEHENPRNGLG